MKKIPLWLIVLIGLLFALFMVTFAVQNNDSVSLVFGKWSFNGSIAVVFILSVCVGFLLACSITLPLVLQKSVSNLNLRTKIARLEKKIQKEPQQNSEHEVSSIAKET